MTELDADIGPLALELIEEYGKLLQYAIKGQATYNPATGTATVSANSFAFKAIVEDYSLQGSGQAFASGLIESGDKKLTTSPGYFANDPTPGDTFVLDGANFTVLNVKATYSGELIALYELQGRA